MGRGEMAQLINYKGSVEKFCSKLTDICAESYPGLSSGTEKLN
jgi:hypothetical protein